MSTSQTPFTHKQLVAISQDLGQAIHDDPTLVTLFLGWAPSSTLHFVSLTNECYTLGPGHYADSIQFLHTSDCAMHLHHIHSHSYSDANNVSPNRGTFGIIHTWWSNANGDRCITLSTGCPSTTTDCKGAAQARASCPWLM